MKLFIILFFITFFSHKNFIYSQLLGFNTTVTLNRYSFVNPPFKATWDTISTPTFEPQSYPIKITEFCSVATTTMDDSFNQPRINNSPVSFSLCEGVIYCTSTSYFEVPSTYNIDYIFATTPLVISSAISIHGIIFLSNANINITFTPGASITFKPTATGYTLPTAFDTQNFFPGILAYGPDVLISPPTGSFITGSAFGIDNITISNSVTSISSTTLELYSESFPNGVTITGCAISGTILSWTNSVQLNPNIDVHVTIRTKDKEYFRGGYSLTSSNGASFTLENMVIAGAGRTMNQEYSCTEPTVPSQCTNQRSRSPIYAEFSTFILSNSIFFNLDQRADIIVHHATLAVSDCRFYGNSGSSILAEWGTESIISQNNIFIKTLPSIYPTVIPTPPANMDYGYQGNAIYSISPNIQSNGDFIYSTSEEFTGISIELISDRENITGTYYDYSLSSLKFQYANLTDYQIDLTNTNIIVPSRSISIKSPYTYSTIKIIGLQTLTGTGKCIFDLQGDLSLKGTFNIPSLPITGKISNLIFSQSTIQNLPNTFINGLNLNSVQFIKSNLVNGYQLDSRYSIRNGGSLPLFYPTSAITPVINTVPVLPQSINVLQDISLTLGLGVGLYNCSLKSLVGSNEVELVFADCNLPLIYTTKVTDQMLNLLIVVYDISNNNLLVKVPLGQIYVIPSNAKFYQGIDFTSAKYVNDTFPVAPTITTVEQWSLCTAVYWCSKSNIGLIQNISSDFQILAPTTPNYTLLNEEGISLSSNTKLSLGFPKPGLYVFTFYLFSFIDFIPWTQSNLIVPKPILASLMVGNTINYVPFVLYTAEYKAIQVTITTTSVNSYVPIAFVVPPSSSTTNVFLSSFLVTSTVPTPSFIVYPTPKPTDPLTEPPTKKKGFNIIYAIVPAIVGALLIGGLILAFILYRKKKNSKPRAPISPLKQSFNNSPLKQSNGSAINMSNLSLSSGAKSPLVPTPSSRNLLNSSGSFKTTTVKEDKYHVDADILSFVQESHFYAWDHPDFPLTFSNTKLDFGMSGMKCPIDHELLDSITLINKSKKPLNISILLPASTSSALCDTDSSTVVIKPGKAHQVNISVKLLCTTKFMEKFAIHVEDFGHTFLFIHLESVLSTKLDFNELEFFQPPIGEGSFGIVYRGQWRGQEIAIKQMKVSSINMDEVYREMDLMSKLRHPNIISFIGAVMSSDNLCIVSEFVPLGSLADILYKGNKKLSMAQKIRVALDIAKGCNFLHQCGIIHRDLKPDNILVVSLAVDAPVSIKISDFGTSKEAAELDYSKFTNAVGTPIYMSNQILEKKDYDNSTDVYSYAIMFYEIIIEEVPFAEIKNMWDIPRFVISGKRPTRGLDSIDPAIVKIINECWAHDATQRPAFKDVIPRLEEILASLIKQTNGSENNV